MKASDYGDLALSSLLGKSVVLSPAKPAQRPIVITGITSGAATPVRNSGRLNIRFVRPGLSDLILAPGETAFFCKGVVHRLACNDCGLSDGSHETWCPLWQPYVAEE